MRLMMAGAAFFGAVLSAGEAAAEPLFLRCEGVASSISVYEPNPTRIATRRYYRIDQQQFSRFQPADVVWPANYCATKGAACSTDENTINARWRDGRADTTVQINRKSGRVLDTADYGSGSNSFVGDCSPSADPAQAGGSNKF